MVGELIAGAASGLTNPATVLFERVSDAVGGVAKPWQIRRVAGAEADAKLILAEADIKITELQQRAARRFIEEETKSQENIENITYQAIPHLNEDAEPENIEDDFLRNFFDKCRIVSDEEMQQMWARILAGEANNPGTFSRKTINVLADMDKRDAELFVQLCRFVWSFPTDIEPIVYSQGALWKQHGLGFSSLTDLTSLGLIRVETPSFEALGTEPLPQTFVASYAGRRVEISFTESSGGQVPIGEVAFTYAGRQLHKIVDSAPVDGLFESMCERWTENESIESVTLLDMAADPRAKSRQQLNESAADTEVALLVGRLREVDQQKGIAQLQDAGGGYVSLRFDSTQGEDFQRLAGRHVEIRGSGRFNDQDDWTGVLVEQLRETQAWSEPFDHDAFLNNPDPKIFNPDELVRIDLTEEEWEAFDCAIGKGREV